MTIQPPYSEPKGLSRRSFFGGVMLGVVGGSAAAGLVLRGRGLHFPQHLETGEVPPMDDKNLDHEKFMRAAIVQAKNVPQLPFGAVIVHAKKAEIVAEGYNRSSASPTFHGEIDVINRCAQLHPDIAWNDMALYTTAEPCPMCQSAIAWAGIGMVVFGSSIPFLQSLGWWQIDIRAEEVVRRTSFRRCTVLGGVLEAECNALFHAVPKGLFRQEK